MPGPSRRSRAVGGRPHQLSVSFSDEELKLVVEAAELAGLAPRAWLGEASTRAARDAVAGAALPSAWSSVMGALMAQRDEVVETRRVLRNIGGNLNQVAAYANATGELHAATIRAVHLVERAVAKAEEGLSHLAVLTGAARAGLTYSRSRRGRGRW